MAFALSGTVRFLASLRNDNGGGVAAFALPGTSSTFIAAIHHCRFDQPPLSSRPEGEISCRHHPPRERHPRKHEISRFASK